MQIIGTDTLYFEISADNPVTHRVRPGEEFEVRTQINRGPWVDTLPADEQVYWRERLVGGNPSSGCIYVEDAKRGDMLSVEIGHIDVDPVAYTAFGGANGATPPDLAVKPCHRLVEVRDGCVHWSDGVRLPVRPMLGYVGVAPEAGSFHNGWGGTWGGNLDAPEVTTGTTIHLRVHHEGALLHVGDMHALQGDGEICGAGGIEAGGAVRLTCRLTRPAPAALYWPRLESTDFIGVAATARPADSAFHAALKDLIAWLCERRHVTVEDSYLFLGQVLEARATQFVNPTVTYVAKIAREYVEALGA